MVHNHYIIPSNFNAYQYNLNFTSRIASLCAPFFQVFGVKSFRYGRIYLNENKYLYLSTNVEWLQHHYEHHTGVGSTFEEQLKCATLDKFHFFIWPSNPKDYFFSDFFDFDIWNGLSVYRRSAEFIEGWCFASNKEHEQILNFYLNGKDWIESFIYDFNLKASNIISPQDNSCFSKMPIPIDLNIPQPNPYFTAIDQIASQKGGPSLGLHINGKWVKFCPREIECLYFLSDGKTTKEAARILNISPRTVETYLNRIKEKTDIHKRAQLISLYFDYINKNKFCWRSQVN